MHLEKQIEFLSKELEEAVSIVDARYIEANSGNDVYIIEYIKQEKYILC